MSPAVSLWILRFAKGGFCEKIGVQFGWPDMNKMSISLDESNQSWVEEQAGPDADAFVNTVIRHEREYHEKLTALRQAIQDGLDSGISDRTVDQIWAGAKSRYKARHG